MLACPGELFGELLASFARLLVLEKLVPRYVGDNEIVLAGFVRRLPVLPARQELLSLQLLVGRLELLLDEREVAVLGQQKFGTEVAVAFRIELPARRIPAGLQDGIQRLGDRLAQALVKVVIEWTEIPVEEVREPPGRRPDVVLGRCSC